MNLKKLKDHLNKYLPLYVIGAMGIGLLVGYSYAPFLKGQIKTFKNLTTLAVFLIIYPMMVNLRMESLRSSAKNIKGILLALFFNFIYAPIFMFALSKIFVTNPTLGFGLLLAMVVPCSSMSIAYTGLSDGNIELSTVVVAISFLTAIIAIPFWLGIFASKFNVPSPVWILVKTILIVLIAPMILGYLTRKLLISKMGEKGFIKLAPLFPSVSLISMYIIVFLIMMMKARLLVTKWHLLLWLLVPITLYYLITLLLISLINKKIGVSYKDHMAVVYASSGKNEGTAIAIATTAFNPLTAVPAAIIPVFQITFLVGYLKIAGLIKRYFAPKLVPEYVPQPEIPQMVSVRVPPSESTVPRDYLYYKVLYPTDFSLFSRSAFEHIKRLKALGTEKVILLHVYDKRNIDLYWEVESAFKKEPPEKVRDKIIKRMLEKNYSRLKEVECEIEEAGLKAQSIVKIGVPWEEIVQVAKDLDVSLIVMGSHGERGIIEKILGSTTARVLRESPVPVLVVKPKMRGSSEQNKRSEPKTLVS